jgi:hypothetical protein
VAKQRIGTPEESECVLGETRQLCVLADYFDTGEVDDAVNHLPHEGVPVRNALVRDFAVSTRQLIEFLARRNDKDLAADDFTRKEWRPPSNQAELDDLRDRFSKQFVHLSRRRPTYSADARRVLSRQIVDTLAPEFRRFLDVADPERLCDGFRDEALAALGGPRFIDAQESPRGVRIGPIQTTAGTFTQSW